MAVKYKKGDAAKFGEFLVTLKDGRFMLCVDGETPATDCKARPVWLIEFQDSLQRLVFEEELLGKV